MSLTYFEKGDIVRVKDTEGHRELDIAGREGVIQKSGGTKNVIVHLDGDDYFWCMLNESLVIVKSSPKKKRRRRVRID